MKERLRLIKSIISVSFIAILLIFTLLVRFESLAWFASSENVNVTGLTVSAHGDTTIKNIRFFRVTDTEIVTLNGVKHNKYKFGFSDSVLSEQTISTIGPNGEIVQVPERDSFEKTISMNPYSELTGDCQILIEVTLSEEENILLSIDTVTKTFLGNDINAKIQNQIYDLNPSGLPLSSVLRFAVFESVVIDDQAFVLEDDDINANQISFIDYSEGTFSFLNPLDADNSRAIPITPNDSKFYLFFDYSSLFVEYINDRVATYVDQATHSAEQMGNTFTDIILGETNLLFIPDFKFVINKGGN